VPPLAHVPVAPAARLTGALALRSPKERAAVLGALSRASGNRAVSRLITMSARPVAPTIARDPKTAKTAANEDRNTFPWTGEITGTWSAALRSSAHKDPADPHTNTRADVPRGTQVLIVGRKGGWLQAQVTLDGNVREGYISQELVKFLRRDAAAPQPSQDAAVKAPADPATTGPTPPPGPGPPGPDRPPKVDTTKPPDVAPPGDEIIDPPPGERSRVKDLLDHARKTLRLLTAAAVTGATIAGLAAALEEAGKAWTTMEVLGVVRYLFFDPATGRLEFDLTNADYEARRRISRASMSEDLRRLEQALKRVHELDARAAATSKPASSTSAPPTGTPTTGTPNTPTPQDPPFKEITKEEYDKLTPAQQQEHLTRWMKAHNVERIIRSAKHHCWPEYLGGPAKQPLLSLDALKHIKFHSLLDTVLPRKLGAAYYAAKSPAEKIKDIATLRRIARDFDLEEGTKISEQLNAVLKGTPYEKIPF
jgi:hypothetical protein